MKILRLCVLLLALPAMAQIYSGNPVEYPTGQPIPNSPIAICAVNPQRTTPPCTSTLAVTFTDETFAIACTLNPTTPGPISGLHCTNPGLTDQLGNWTVYINGGSNFWAQFYPRGLQASVTPFSLGGSGGGGSPPGLPLFSLQYNNVGTFGGDSVASTDGNGNLFATSINTINGYTPQSGVLALSEQPSTGTQFAGIFQLAALTNHTQVCSTNSGWNECFQKTFAVIQPGTNIGALHIGSGGSLTVDSGGTFSIASAANGCGTFSGGVLGSTGIACGGGGTAGLSWPTVNKTADYTIASSDFSTSSAFGNCITLTGTVAHTFTLPASVSTNGQTTCVSNQSTQSLTIGTTGGITIDGQTTFTLGPSNGIFIVWNGTNFQSAGRKRINSTDIGSVIYSSDSGAANAYVMTLGVIPPGGLNIGWAGCTKPANTNTTTSTLSVNGFGPFNITQYGLANNVTAGQLVSGRIACFHFDFGSSTFQLDNPQAAPTQYAAGGGTAQAQTVTIVDPVPTSYIAGMTVRWLPTAANTAAAPTLNVNSLGTKTITKLGTTALLANDLTTTAVAVAIYDGTRFQLQNPQTATSAGSALVSYRGLCQAGVGSAKIEYDTATAPSLGTCADTGPNVFEWYLPSSTTVDIFRVTYIVPTAFNPTTTVTTVFDTADTTHSATLRLDYSCETSGTTNVHNTLTWTSTGTSVTASTANANILTTVTSTFSSPCVAGDRMHLRWFPTANTLTSNLYFAEVTVAE